MAKHPFLSDEWVAAAREIRGEYQGRTAPNGHQMRMNLLVHAVPFGDGTRRAYVDSTEGEARVELGHLDVADVTVSTDYETAKALVAHADPQTALQAFMDGKVQIQGDMTKLMSAMQHSADPVATELRQRIKDITE